MKRYVGLVLLVALALGGSSGAATLPDPSKEDYTVGPRDRLHINLWGEDKMDVKVAVSGLGTINYFFLTDVQVAGLTIAQIREKLTRLLKDGYYKNPVLIVQMEEYKSKEVQIQGEVDRPGILALDTNYTTLLRLISLAGGAKENRGPLAYIYRGGVIAVRAHEAKSQPPTPAPTPAPAPAPDLPADSDKEKPSPDKDKENQTAPTPPTDHEKYLEVLEGKERVQVNLRLLLDQGDISQDVAVYPGDFVYIESFRVGTTQNFVWVEGAVKNPRSVEWQPGLTVLQAIIQAGGALDLASPNRTTITRTGPGGVQTVIRVKVKSIQRGKKPDVPLQPGDRITVPESVF